jgi:hypothetical protein
MTSLLIGYVEVEEPQPQDTEAGPPGPETPVKAGTGLIHAYVEDDSDESLCGKPILDPTHRSFPGTDGSEGVCPECLELSAGL